jgi:hypothetical protein
MRRGGSKLKVGGGAAVESSLMAKLGGSEPRPDREVCALFCFLSYPLTRESWSRVLSSSPLSVDT